MSGGRKVSISGEVSVVPGVNELVRRAERLGVLTPWHRYLLQQPQCGFGMLGICCRNCNMGPCRIDPSGFGPSVSVCGSDANTIIARNLLRMVAAGAATRSSHCREVLGLLKASVSGLGYGVSDFPRFAALASLYGVKDFRNPSAAVDALIRVLSPDFGGLEVRDRMLSVEVFAPQARLDRWGGESLIPRSVNDEVCDCIYMTHTGVNAEPRSLIRQALRTAVADSWGASRLTVEVMDALFGPPEPTESLIGLGVLRKGSINVVVSTDNPALSFGLVKVAKSSEGLRLAEEFGASSINVVGTCCTCGAVLAGAALPIACDLLTQEVAVLTGAADAVVVDYPCTTPYISEAAKKFHTKVVVAGGRIRVPGAEHVPFTTDSPLEACVRILKLAATAFSERGEVYIPPSATARGAMLGFSVDGIKRRLGGSLDPLLDAMRGGSVRGIVGIMGCANPKVRHGYSYLKLTEELIRRDVLVIGSGCWALAVGTHGLLSEEAVTAAGPGLRSFCREFKLPPCLHVGGCTDCSRILKLFAELARRVGCDLSELPVAVSATEWMSEKLVSMSMGVVASGIFTHLGTVPPVLGSFEMLSLITDGVEELCDGRFYIEPDPKLATDTIVKVIEGKRGRLGWGA